MMGQFQASARNLSVCFLTLSPEPGKSDPSSPISPIILLNPFNPPRCHAAPAARLICETKPIDNPAFHRFAILTKPQRVDF
jgi:hypothetical protein